MNEKEITKLRELFLSEIENEKDAEKRRKICKRHIEEKLSSVFCSLKNLSGEKRTELGKMANELRKFITEKMTEEKGIEKEEKDWFDITFPGTEPNCGHIHPLTKLQKRCEQIFSKIGFLVVEGPELENEWYNFDALNFKPDHPVREMQDTLFVKQEKRNELSEREKLLMRTHTSPNQVRCMERMEPPLRIIVPGKVYRNEATDRSHNINFYQLEGLMVGEKISIANFRAIIGYFFQELFESSVEIRLRPSFFPFTEPSFEVDVSCSICNKKGCSVCKNTGWIEIMGAGMVHPNVLESAKIDSTKYNGFAFGMGIDRVAMIVHKVDDIRLFYSGDLRFLKQF
jgi:phenylalanyl-tRNA synthetase alpha chain